jgi:hypothetical protein
MKEAIGLLGFFRPVVAQCLTGQSLERHADVQTDCVEKSRQEESMQHTIQAKVF